MKKTLCSFISFSRTERIGLIALCSILLLLLIIRSVLVYVSSKEAPYLRQIALEKEPMQSSTASSGPADNTPEPKQATDIPAAPHKDYQDNNDEQTTPLPDIININTADSATLVRLKGIGPATAHKVMEYRRGGNVFTDMEDFRKLLRMPHKTYDLLQPHLALHGKQK